MAQPEHGSPAIQQEREPIRTLKQAKFTFHAELNDFLPERRKNLAISLAFNGNQSVKHLIESLGVPHTELERILVNRSRVDLGYLVQDGDAIAAYPPGKSALKALQAAERGFLLDNHLGRLAVYLRMLGFDCLYRNDYQDAELAQLSTQQERVLLTRDVRLLMRSAIQHGYWVRSKVPRQQLIEVVRRFDLKQEIAPFQRCMRCNGVLQRVSKQEVLERLEPLTKKYFNEFRRCPECSQVYWKGSHYQRMLRFIQQTLEESPRNTSDE